MIDTQTPVRFFMGANTPNEFKAYLNDLYNCNDGWRAYLIKSGPGTGKATLMRRVLDRMTTLGQEAHALICSSDPNSLDGLLFPEIKTCILDATAPHIIEPRFWSSGERIVNLSACMDAKVLHPQLEAISKVTEECTQCHVRGRKFIAAASSFLAESARIVLEYTDQTKIHRSAARIAAREFGSCKTIPGKEYRRFLSAVTPQGLITFHETLLTLCARVYSIEDEYGASSQILLEDLRRRALEAGYEVYTCVCPLSTHEKIDHLMIPSIGVAFTTSNPWHKADFPVYRRIHAARFTDMERLRLRKQVLSFNRRAARELLSEAVSIAAEAKAVHDRIEEFHVPAMDWESADRLTNWVIKEFEDILSATMGDLISDEEVEILEE